MANLTVTVTVDDTDQKVLKNDYCFAVGKKSDRKLPL